MEFQGIDFQNITLTGAALLAVYFLIKLAIPKIVAYLDKKVKEKEDALIALADKHDRKIELKDESINRLIKDHEERSDRKDKALEVLTGQVLKESQQNRELNARAVNAIAEFKTELIPLREYRSLASEQLKTAKAQVERTHDLIQVATDLVMKIK